MASNYPSRNWNEPEEEQKWRQVNLQWTEQYYKDTKVSIENCKPRIPDISAYNVLLVGCIQAGKSSSVTTFMTALREQYGQYAVSGAEDKSITKTLKKFVLRKKELSGIAVNVWDSMGFEECVSPAGPTMRDMEYIMDGHIKDGYKLDPKESISFHSPHFRQEPQPSDKMHVVVIVVPASSISAMHIDVQGKLKQVIQLAREKDIRVALLLTKCDEACNQVKADLTKVLRSRSILNAAQDAQEKLGINLNNVYVIKNYHGEVESDLLMNTLALDSLQHILNLADSTLESQNMEFLEEQDRAAAQTPLLDTPCRPVIFSKEELDTKWTELTDLSVDGMDSLNICLFGPIGSGKSGFIDSCLSEFYQRIVTTAFTGAHDATTPTTTSFAKYPVCLGGPDGQRTAMTLCDTMGVAPCKDMGLYPSDVDLVLDGHVRHKEVFNSIVPMPRRTAEKGPLSERMHLAVITVDGTKLDQLDLQKPKLDEIIHKAHMKGVTACVLVTNMDRVCGHVCTDPRQLYRSEAVKNCLEKVGKALTIPQSQVFPIVNFHNDTEIDWRKSLLIVDALTTMTQCAMDYITEQKAELKRSSGARSGWNIFG